MLKAVQESQHLAMLDHYPLRCASRSRSIHHIRQVLWCHPTGQGFLALLRNMLPVRIQADYMYPCSGSAARHCRCVTSTATWASASMVGKALCRIRLGLTAHTPLRP